MDVIVQSVEDVRQKSAQLGCAYANVITVQNPLLSFSVTVGVDSFVESPEAALLTAIVDKVDGRKFWKQLGDFTEYNEKIYNALADWDD